MGSGINTRLSKGLNLDTGIHNAITVKTDNIHKKCDTIQYWERQ
jgi:hypothetical protein